VADEAALNSKISALERKLAREHAARLSAEAMLNDYSKDAYLANQALRRELSEVRSDYIALLHHLDHRDIELGYTPSPISPEMGQRMALLSQMAAGIAHEINNPMAFVKSNAQISFQLLTDMVRGFNELKALARQSGVTDKTLSNLEQSYMVQEMSALNDEIYTATLEGIDRVTNIVASLRAYAYPAPNEKAMVALGSAIENSVEAVMHKIPVDVQVCILPICAKLHVMGSAEKLLVLFSNLLHNALAAVAKKGQITISVVVGKASIAVTVADNGIGMNEAQLKLIFTPFYSTQPPGSGAGLGLTVAMAIMEEHNGQITVESCPGEGATFTLVFPLANEA